MAKFNIHADALRTRSDYEVFVKRQDKIESTPLGLAVVKVLSRDDFNSAEDKRAYMYKLRRYVAKNLMFYSFMYLWEDKIPQEAEEKCTAFVKYFNGRISSDGQDTELHASSSTVHC